jgi:TonB family protein
MALTGQLSDMSLAELIEFFCNQRKTGRLKVDYHRGHGVFFIKEGELVDAKVGQLSGAKAVYFALTLPNAAFDFSPEVLPTRRTINEAWTQVVLEGLRQLDEGISPTESDAFGSGWSPTDADIAVIMDQVERLGESASKNEVKSSDAAPLSTMFEGAGAEGGGKKKWVVMAVAACVVLIVGVVCVPLMRGTSGKPAPRKAAQPSAAAQTDVPSSTSAESPEAAAPADDAQQGQQAASAEDAAQAAQREARERKLREQRERERKADEARKAAGADGAEAGTPATAAASGPKSVRVQITYDEAGRVTGASVAGASPGAEAFGGTAVRIARGKRFPAGKAGTAVVTIPVN